ncbi:MAG: hypothetical protein ACFHWX_18650 [Bacteroidota bacterium]
MIELDINELPKLYLIEKYRQDEPWEYDSKFSGKILASGHDYEELFRIVAKEDNDHYNYEDDETMPALTHLQLEDSPFYIVWMIPADIEKAVDYVIDKLPKQGVISAMHLADCYHNYMERLHLVPEGSARQFDEDVYNMIIERFDEKVKGLPNAPDESTWDELDEEIGK